MIDFSNKPLNEDVVVGSKVRCLQLISFLSQEHHTPGEVYVVEEETLQYYRTFCDNKNYALIKHDDDVDMEYFG